MNFIEAINNYKIFILFLTIIFLIIMALVKIEFEVFGIVQGVYFRAYTREYARSIDIKGWVKNTLRSTVIGEGEGTRENIDKFKY